jgi:hypothetical protein
MKIISACLCETAKVDPATLTLSIEGAWPEWVSVSTLPCQGDLTLAAVAELDRVEMNINLHLDVRIQCDADRALLAQSEISIQRPFFEGYDPTAPLFLPFVLPLRAELRMAGAHRIVLQHRNDPAISVEFGVRVA